MITITKNSKFNKAIELLERWQKVEIPDNIWSDPGEDYLLPLDTQVFLKELEERSKR